MPLLPGNLIWQTTSTSGTGAFTLAAPQAGHLSYAMFANGSQVPYFRFDSTPQWEDGAATVSTVGGVTTLTPITRYGSSNGGAPVNWPAGGTQNVKCDLTAGLAVLKPNAGSEYSAVGDTFCGNVGAATDGVRGLSGGSDGRVVRISTANTCVNAINTETGLQLSSLLYRSGGKYYRPGTLVPSLSGLVAGQTYFLGDNTTPLLSTPVAIGSSKQSVFIGTAVSTTSLFFEPGKPVLV